MSHKIAIVTGTSGAGKTTAVRALTGFDARFVTVQAVTTRSPRSDDPLGAYEHITREQFAQLLDSKELFVEPTRDAAGCAGSAYDPHRAVRA